MNTSSWVEGQRESLLYALLRSKPVQISSLTSAFCRVNHVEGSINQLIMLPSHLLLSVPVEEMVSTRPGPCFCFLEFILFLAFQERTENVASMLPGNLVKVQKQTYLNKPTSTSVLYFSRIQVSIIPVY